MGLGGLMIGGRLVWSLEEATTLRIGGMIILRIYILWRRIFISFYINEVLQNNCIGPFTHGDRVERCFASAGRIRGVQVGR